MEAGGPAIAPGSKGSGAMNDWICPNMDCSNKNYARRMECNKCGTKRPRPKIIGPATGIGEKMAEHSKGLFSPEDWQCMMCGNINWAKRSECNVCNHPKEGKIEQREGVGGGFKENDNVQYREFQDDSEYDEFGRKKKKGKKGNTGSTLDTSWVRDAGPTGVQVQSSEGPKPLPEEGDGEEDEEEDEDGDTSKYDLFNFEDEGTNKAPAVSNLEEEEDDDDDVDTSKYDIFADETATSAATMKSLSSAPSSVTAQLDTATNSTAPQAGAMPTAAHNDNARPRSRSPHDRRRSNDSRRDARSRSPSRSRSRHKSSRSRSKSPSRRKGTISRSRSPSRRRRTDSHSPPRSHRSDCRSRSPAARRRRTRSRSPPRRRRTRSRSRSPRRQRR